MRRPNRLILSILGPAITGIAFAAVWIATTGTFQPQWWVLVATSVGLGVLSYAIETVPEAHRRRARRLPSRRAHARPHPTTRKAAP